MIYSHFLKSLSVDSLVKKWSPLVWLAPNEKFLPGDVSFYSLIKLLIN